MSKSYLPHLGTIFLIHALVLLGSWQISQSDYVRAKIGSSVLKLQIATNVMMPSAPVQKKVEKVLPVNPDKPKIAPVKEQKVVETKEAAPVESGGSEAGTDAKGSTDLADVYKAELRAMIDKNKYYPTMSKRLGQTGTVVVAFTLLKDGHIIDVRIDKPSRYERLNDSALDAVKKVERFKPIPNEIGETRMDIKVPVKFFTF